MKENISLSLEETGLKSEFHLTSFELSKACSLWPVARRFQAQSRTFVIILRLLSFVVGEIYMFALFLYIRVNLFGDAKFNH